MKWLTFFDSQEKKLSWTIYIGYIFIDDCTYQRLQDGLLVFKKDNVEHYLNPEKIVMVFPFINSRYQTKVFA